jgi:hypothetical protein
VELVAVLPDGSLDAANAGAVVASIAHAQAATMSVISLM